MGEVVVLGGSFDEKVSPVILLELLSCCFGRDRNYRDGYSLIQDSTPSFFFWDETGEDVSWQTGRDSSTWGDLHDT